MIKTITKDQFISLVGHIAGNILGIPKVQDNRTNLDLEITTHLENSAPDSYDIQGVISQVLADVEIVLSLNNIIIEGEDLCNKEDGA